MLPPSCLTMPRMDLSVETMMGMSKKTSKSCNIVLQVNTGSEEILPQKSFNFIYKVCTGLKST